MTESIGSRLELHGDVRLATLWLEELRAIAQDVIDHVVPDKQWQKFVDDHPLVMPRRQQTRAEEHFGGPRVAIRTHKVYTPIMELQERCMQPSDHDVLV